MKFGIQLNPQVSIEKPPETLLPTLAEQTRVADEAGFEAITMGQHYNIPGLQRLHQVPLLGRLCAEAKRAGVGTAATLLGLHDPVVIAKELATIDVMNEGRAVFSFGLGYRQQELDAFNLTKSNGSTVSWRGSRSSSASGPRSTSRSPARRSN